MAVMMDGDLFVEPSELMVAPASKPYPHQPRQLAPQLASACPASHAMVSLGTMIDGVCTPPPLAVINNTVSHAAQLVITKLKWIATTTGLDSDGTMVTWGENLDNLRPILNIDSTWTQH